MHIGQLLLPPRATGGDEALLRQKIIAVSADGTYVRPGQPFFVPERSTAKTFEFVLRIWKDRMISFTDIRFENKEKQEKGFYEFAVRYFEARGNHYEAGFFKKCLGDQQGALEDFFKGLEKAPSDFRILTGIGVMKKRLGHEDYAEYLEKAACVAPERYVEDIRKKIDAPPQVVIPAEYEIEVVEERHLELSDDGRIRLDHDAETETFDYVVDLVNNGKYYLENMEFRGSKPQAESFLKFAKKRFLKRTDFINAAIAMIYLHDYENAFLRLSATKRVEADNPVVHKWCAVAEYYLGLTDEAFKDIEEAKKLDPANIEWFDRFLEQRQQDLEKKSIPAMAKDELGNILKPWIPQDIGKMQKWNAKILQLRGIYEKHFYKAGGKDDYERVLTRTRRIAKARDNRELAEKKAPKP